ncbi:hypothetical protein RI129_006197 [Pyrocoelia pectoralis]|uniref:Acyltransferase n=1 Tax=Pyrocoelia pectoralis TaxID=417401 RepID=A0AAN7ZI55_9COLE
MNNFNLQVKSVYNYLHKVKVKIGVSSLTVSLFFGFPLSMAIVVYVGFYTPFWPLLLIYLIWMYTVDKSTCETGGRKKLNLRWCNEHYVDYFPLTYEINGDVELDPAQNYLFCCYPHAVISYGAIVLFTTNIQNGFRKLFPKHAYRMVTLGMLFNIPFVREVFLETGACSASERSLNHLLGNSGGGTIVGLVVGGAEEALYAKPGEYRIILNNRRGFIRVALKNGTPIVPVFSFGANETFAQIHNRYILAFQRCVKTITGAFPVFMNGHGYFQDSFGLVPLQKPIHTVIGKPIEVQKVLNPTKEEINNLHQKFKEELTRISLFNEYKLKYIENSENVNLIIH